MVFSHNGRTKESTLGDLFGKGTFSSFQELWEKYDLNTYNLFRYLQIRDHVKTYMQDYNTASPDKLNECLNRHADTDKLISCIYNVLQNNTPPSEVYRRAWEDEMGQQISNYIWDESLQFIHTCSLNTRRCLIQFKVRHRLYYSKTKLNKIFPSSSPLR